LEEHSGNWFGYFARLTPVAVSAST
jgi:hypothetical protein